jgi:ADP-ribose pyrophosphatase YjhB (NUDIX family)
VSAAGVPGAAPPRIRVLAVAVARDGDRLLVERGHDPHGDRHYYRAIGGGVEFGERAADAVRREWREEFALDLDALTPLGVLESLFTYAGRPGHEIVFAYAARVRDARALAAAELAAVDPEGLAHVAVWVPLAELAEGPVPLYPEGLLALLRGAAPTA